MFLYTKLQMKTYMKKNAEKMATPHQVRMFYYSDITRVELLYMNKCMQLIVSV